MEEDDRLMGKITVTTSQLNRFFRSIRQATNLAVQNAMKDMSDVLFKQSEILASTIENSKEFQDLSGRLVGEFGFTPEEVAQLPSLIQLLVPGTDRNITRISLKSSPQSSFAILEWADIENLKAHPIAQHELTKFDGTINRFQLTATISWVEWLEEGAVVRDYVFDPSSRGKFSRSGAGIMRETQGGLWTFEPTFIFKRTGEKFNTQQIKKGFGVLVKKRLRNR